jgi:hypothetical protein
MPRADYVGDLIEETLQGIETSRHHAGRPQNLQDDLQFHAQVLLHAEGWPNRARTAVNKGRSLRPTTPNRQVIN